MPGFLSAVASDDRRASCAQHFKALFRSTPGVAFAFLGFDLIIVPVAAFAVRLLFSLASSAVKLFFSSASSASFAVKLLAFPEALAASAVRLFLCFTRAPDFT